MYLVGCLFGRVSGAVSGGLRLRGIPPPRVFGGLSVGARRGVRVRRTPENACVRVRVRANARVPMRALAPLEIESEFKIEIRIEVGNET